MNKELLKEKLSEELIIQNKVLDNKKNTNGCLIVKSANRWVQDAKNRPIPNMLFSEFWYEGELCILFADTNIGKSILAVQIADSLSKGKSIYGFKNDCNPKNVLYLDFELSDKQFENRCSDNYKNHYEFHSNFFRAELNAEMSIPKEYKTIEDYLSHSLEKLALDKHISVIIVDNLTYLKTDNERAKEASELMKLLKQLTKKHNISILALAHTPKRDDSKPITKNDLAGSKMLMNFCDSSFAIGGSTINTSYRYLKQIKQRNTEHLYHSENIVICELIKNCNFLQFSFLEYGIEKEHLRQSSFNSIEDRDDRIIELTNQGMSNVKIGEELGLSEGAIRKRKRKLDI